jgi:hypothetical protein
MTATWCWISAHIKTTNVNKLRIIIAPDRHKPGYECPTFTSDHDNVSKKNMREEEVSPIQPNEGITDIQNEQIGRKDAIALRVQNSAIHKHLVM